MTIQENIPLAQYTTFKIGGPARFFCTVRNEAEILEAVNFAKDRNLAIFMLGGGSNILVGDEGFGGLVVKMEIMGIEELIEDDAGSERIVAVGAGEQWDTFVDYAVERGLQGIENLSAIPGSVGAAPVQNIGAYGADISRVVSKVRAFDTRQMKFVDLDNGACQFSYRDSLFKKEKGRYMILRVIFSLKSGGRIDISYKDLADYFLNKNNPNPNLKEVRDAVIDIRWNKLPDWKLWGTAGSFFKNPIISKDEFESLKRQYPELPGFAEADGRIKVSLGWILDKICHAKGLSKGNVSVYEKQALVLVAKPGATAKEVVDLAHDLMNRVKEKTGITIEGEVEWVN